MARACQAAAPAAQCVPVAVLGGVDFALGGDGLGITAVGAPGEASRDGRGEGVEPEVRFQPDAVGVGA